MHEWDEAEKLIVQAMELEPENKVIKSTMAQFLAGVPSIPAHGSIYDIKLLVTHRDSDDNLIAVSESSNTRYLPYSLTEKIFEKHLIEKNVVINGKTYDIAQKIASFSPSSVKKSGIPFIMLNLLLSSVSKHDSKLLYFKKVFFLGCKSTVSKFVNLLIFTILI